MTMKQSAYYRILTYMVGWPQPAAECPPGWIGRVKKQEEEKKKKVMSLTNSKEMSSQSLRNNNLVETPLVLLLSMALYDIE